MEKQRLCQKLGIALHRLRSGSPWRIQSASGLNPCHLWTSLCKNVLCPGSLEVTGIPVLVVILSNFWSSEDSPTSLLCFSLELGSSFLIRICRTARVLCFCEEFYLFLFHPPSGSFCFASGFLAVYPAFEQEHLSAPGASWNNGLRRNAVHHFFLDHCTEEWLI